AHPWAVSSLGDDEGDFGLVPALGEVGDAFEPAHATPPVWAIGMEMPWAFAWFSAAGYPASTWRSTPVSGSFASPRSSFCAASTLPSATLTWPAWIDLPMPTPPPWWMETHEAPEEAFTSAFSKGQSAMASEPSAIASVSRYGDATDPESRWSLPITIGAVRSPAATMALNSRPARSRSPRPS